MTKKEKLIFDHYEEDLRILRNRLVQIISEVDKVFDKIEELKKNLDYGK